MMVPDTVPFLINLFSGLNFHLMIKLLFRLTFDSSFIFKVLCKRSFPDPVIMQVPVKVHVFLKYHVSMKIVVSVRLKFWFQIKAPIPVKVAVWLK